jgi:hypothetical protein
VTAAAHKNEILRVLNIIDDGENYLAIFWQEDK